MSAPGHAGMVRVFGRIDLLRFGGPAAQIALMHRELVEDRTRLSEAQYLRALSLCMLLPGPEAMQRATYAGCRLRGVPGRLIAGLPLWRFGRGLGRPRFWHLWRLSASACPFLADFAAPPFPWTEKGYAWGSCSGGPQ